MVAHYKSFEEYISAHGKAEELKFTNYKDVPKVKEVKVEKKPKKVKKSVQTD